MNIPFSSKVLGVGMSGSKICVQSISKKIMLLHKMNSYYAGSKEHNSEFSTLSKILL